MPTIQATKSHPMINLTDEMPSILFDTHTSRLNYAQQQRITRLCIRCALLLMQYGAESVVVVDLTKRLGAALGIDGVECGLSLNAVTLTTLYQGRCITTVRNTVHQGINVSILVQIQQIILSAENHQANQSHCLNTQSHDACINSIEQGFDAIYQTVYSNHLVSFFVGVSCASFAYLNGATLLIALITLIASFVAMRLRMYLLKQHFNPFVVAMITAFTATLLAALAYFLNLGANADIAVAASVLLLVPSFPIINALSDILKGYMNMGVGRWMFATMLTLSACVGIVMTLIFLRIPHWGL